MTTFTTQDREEAERKPMNANELADLIGLCGDGGYNQDAATMLRQQQEQIDKLTAIVALREMDIEALKQTIDANNLSQNIGQFVKPANEPVAWMFQGAFDISTYVSFEKPNPDIYPNPTPLYTHPAKTLTDEEITDVYVECMLPYGEFNEHEFAKAILRKAQEL
jgi:hypothetical protein